MELNELSRYAEEQLNIREEQLWRDFPGFSVLRDPRTDSWIAVFIRSWDGERGERVELCDIKCGFDAARGLRRSYLGAPFRMKGKNWIGVRFGEDTEPEIVRGLLASAYSLGGTGAFTVVLEPAGASKGKRIKAVPLFAGSTPEDDAVPKKIREMLRLYECGDGSFRAKCENFRRQALFMRDYTDDAPIPDCAWHYFPVYHDLTARELRGYFSWRRLLREGKIRPAGAAYSYIYAYELLNGTEGEEPRRIVESLGRFASDYAEKFDEAGLLKNLRTWMLEISVINALPGAESFLDAASTERERALSALASPEERETDEVFGALAYFYPALASSPAATERGRELFAAIVRYNAKNGGGFGKRTVSAWYPLANAVCVRDGRPQDAEYAVTPSLIFRCRAGAWTRESLGMQGAEKTRLEGFCRLADRIIRKKLKTGAYLRAKRGEETLEPLIVEAISDYERPKIKIDLSGLDKIRLDAAVTRDSLLTEEELREPEETPAQPIPEGLTDFQAELLRRLLAGLDTKELLRENGVSALVAADAVNEALYDEIGDSVLFAEDGEIQLAEDYIEDIRRILGGTE